MVNAKWYLLCDEVENVAVDLLQIPEAWRDIPDMLSLDDEKLATIGEWSDNPGMTFLSVEEARSRGFNVDSIDLLISVRAEAIRNWIRTMRDPILAMTDAFTVADRWATYDVVAQNDIAQFRTALRDLTKQNILSVVWPSIPSELDFLRSFNYSALVRPDPGFIDMLQKPCPPKTIEQIKADQWLRIHDERELRKKGGVKLAVSGKEYWFWTDEPTRTQYALLADRARRNNFEDSKVLANWKTMSGEFVLFTVELLHRIIDTGIDAENELFEIAELHRQEMEASSDPLNYNFHTGWPSTYLDVSKAAILPVQPAQTIAVLD